MGSVAAATIGHSDPAWQAGRADTGRHDARLPKSMCLNSPCSPWFAVTAVTFQLLSSKHKAALLGHSAVKNSKPPGGADLPAGRQGRKVGAEIKRIFAQFFSSRTY